MTNRNNMIYTKIIKLLMAKWNMTEFRDYLHR